MSKTGHIEGAKAQKKVLHVSPSLWRSCDAVIMWLYKPHSSNDKWLTIQQHGQGYWALRQQPVPLQQTVGPKVIGPFCQPALITSGSCASRRTPGSQQLHLVRAEESVQERSVPSTNNIVLGMFPHASLVFERKKVMLWVEDKTYDCLTLAQVNFHLSTQETGRGWSASHWAIYCWI